jgi:transposase
MKPYSVDLRQRVVDAYRQDEGSKKELAERFAISLSSVERWIRQNKATGTVTPRPNPAGKARAIVKEEDRELLVQWYKEQPDMTYDEMAARFTQETGRSIGRSTMGATVLLLKITRKKDIPISEAGYRRDNCRA